MDAIKLLVVFLVIILLLWRKCNLAVAIGGGMITTAIVYWISPLTVLKIQVQSALSKTTLSIILVCYLITFLQRMLEKRGHLELARTALDGLFHSPRVNASVAPIFIGLLPSPGAVFISGAMVKATAGDTLSKEDQAFITSFYRHIPEAFLPTYASILIALSVAPQIPVGSFVLAMLPVVAILFALGYFFYLCKLPKHTPVRNDITKRQSLKDLVTGMWSILAIIVLIIVFNLSVYLASALVIVAAFFINRFTFDEVKPFFRSAFETNIVIPTVIIMMFKDVLAYTGAITALPELFGRLPISQVAIFSLLFFLGTIISGSNAMVAMCMPMAFAAIPTGDLPLFVLLMSLTYMAMQLSPTHICLGMVAEYFGVSFSSLVKRTIPITLIFIVLVFGYYGLLVMLL